MRDGRLTCSLAAAFLVACPQKKAPEAPPPPDDSAVATVDGEAITPKEFDRALREERSAIGEGAGAAINADAVKRAVLDDLVERVLLMHAAREANIAVSGDEVERELMRVRSDLGAEALSEVIDGGDLSPLDLKRSTAVLMTIQKLLREQVYSRLGATEEEIRDYYEEHAGEFHQPEEVRAAQIVVRTAEEAKLIVRQIRSGKDFAELARNHSVSPDAKRGGDLGYFPRGQMPRPFDEVIFKLKVNQVSGVVRTDYGFHLFKLLARRPARELALPELKGIIEERLLRQKREQAHADYVKMLKGKAVVKVNEAALAAISAGPSR